MTEKTKQEVSIEGKIGHYTGILHSLCHLRAEMPTHCTQAVEALDTSIAQAGKLLTHLISGEMPQAH